MDISMMGFMNGLVPIVSVTMISKSTLIKDNLNKSLMKIS